MKKNIISVAALLCAAASLVLSILALSGADSRRLAQLEQENARLSSQMEQLIARLEETGGVSGSALSRWTLDVLAWEDSTGADITLTAAPGTYREGMSAQLEIALDNQTLHSIPCSWNGEAFTATAGLSAADGYGYSLLLTLPEGNTEFISLTGPDDPVQDIPVYLASSLSAYCNLIVDSWTKSGGQIVLDTAFIQVQLPRISTEGTPAVESARLVFTHNGKDIHTLPLSLLPGETVDSYALTLTGTGLPLPETAEEDLLELKLEVELTTGTTLTASGISWFHTDGELYAVVG